jgi:protein arginine kinase activator
MKCQHCGKPATFHITEVTSGKPQELHLCEDHARDYLTQTGPEPASLSSMAAAMAQHMAEQMGVTETANELSELDQETCPVCGMSFYQFRTQGRLGCPNDYHVFEEHLRPLIVNIHGEVEHTGKSPAHSAKSSREQTNLIRIKRDLKEAIKEEDYERASGLRDEINRIESEI